MARQKICPRGMRDALSAFATGVTIVTTTDQDGLPIGMTASSFNSVSMDPPLILWSVTRSALSAPVFRDAAYFSVHVLSSDQVKLSNKFAQRGAEKFSGVHFTTNEHNVPLLRGAVSRFDCAAWQVYDGGDHWIIVGEVYNLECNNAESLVFSGGSYATASPIRLNSNHDISEVGNPGKPAASCTSLVDNMLLYNLSRAQRQMSMQFHQSVRESGLSVSEWRILASLYGQATCTLDELAAPSFIDPHALIDMLVTMRQNGLCLVTGALEVANTDIRITGTAAGHERVEHLFALGEQQAHSALVDTQGPHEGGKNRKTPHAEYENPIESLINLLQRVIRNTDK